MASWNPVGALGAALALLLGAGLAACSNDPADDDPPTEYLVVNKAWLPGERDAYIQRVMTNRELVFLFVGDISDLAPQIFADVDSHAVLVPNPAFSASVLPSAPALMAAPQFNASWNFFALKLTVVNNNPVPPDTIFWHLVLWSDPANALDHGFAIGHSRANTFNFRPINTTVFEANEDTLGAAAGEFHASTGTLWLDDASGGRYQVTSQTYPGAFSAINTGPFLGGQIRSGTQFGRVGNSLMVRQVGAENPASFTVGFDYRLAPGIAASEIVCVFPTPCTTNVPALQASWNALRRAH